MALGLRAPATSRDERPHEKQEDRDCGDDQGDEDVGDLI
jgi:hypothetical protein